MVPPLPRSVEDIEIFCLIYIAVRIPFGDINGCGILTFSAFLYERKGK
jgi:hypothetical protein